MTNIQITKKQTYYLGFIAIALSIFQQIIYLFHGFIVFFGFIADIIITICAINIRFRLIDFEATSKYIIKTDNIGESIGKELKPSRFINYMWIVMSIGTIASIAIHYNFIIGIMVYFVMQIVLIYAFSGIVHYRAKLVFSASIKPAKRMMIVSTIGFAIVMPILFFLMIVPGWGLYSLFIFPYILVLIFMTLMTYWHLGYAKRPLKFRMMLCVGASFFLFSDLMIGYSIFNPFILAPLFIYPTWILTIFFLQFALLELEPKLT